MADRFHILVGNACNNNCVFCMESRTDPLRLGAQQRAPELIRAELQAHVASGEVMFASGEPTLEPRLPTYVAWARELGYRRIGLTTNARRLGYERYTRRLLESGLNHLVVSIHGPDARTHDRETRCPGSFEQTVAGLAVAARLRRERRLSLHSSTVVGRRNLDRLADTFALLRSFELDQYVFNVIQPRGRAEPLTGQIMAPYREVAGAFERLLGTIPPPRPAMYLVDIPFCTTERLPPEVRGTIEYAFFTASRGKDRAEVLRVQQDDSALRAKRPECARCRYDAACAGVWRSYLHVHGWEEFVPVADVTAPHARGSPG